MQYQFKSKLLRMRSSVLFILAISINLSFGLYCYWNSGCSYNLFSSKTSYSAIRGDIRDSLVKIEDCEPIGIWGMMKHGKRYPTTKNNDEKFNVSIRDHIVASFVDGNSSLCAQDVENLRDWPLDMKIINRIGALTEEGQQDCQGIAYRLKHAFPSLFDNLSIENYDFKPSASENTIESAKAFIKGLGLDNIKLEEPLLNVTVFDPISPYLECKKYHSQIFETKEIYKEAYKYLNSTEILVTKDRIQRRLGVNFLLTNKDILSLYDLCRYSWSSKTLSPWCALFTTEDLKLLEYYHDLKHYYRSGYGYPDVEKFGSLALVDLLERFRDTKIGKGKNINIHFTYSSTLNIVSSALGLYKDEIPLTAAHRNPERNWITSKIAAFSANLFAVLNRCGKNSKEEYNVVFYYNENTLDKICNGGICSWHEFENMISKFQNIAENFNEYKIKLCDEP